MGVDRGVGNTLQSAAVKASVVVRHFVTEGLTGLDFGTGETFVYVSDRNTQLLAASGLHVMAAAKEYGKGRSLFLGALPFDLKNARLLHRALFWVARQEKELKKAYCENPATECAYYPGSGNHVIVNNPNTPQATRFYDISGRASTIKLNPYASVWK